jgi:mRNA interferase MazF
VPGARRSEPVGPLRGEVYWLTSRQPVGRRPVLVIQNDAGNRWSTATIVAFLSTAPRRAYPFMVALEAGELRQPAWVHCETLTTAAVSRLEDRLGALSPEAMRAVDQALKISLALK